MPILMILTIYFLPGFVLSRIMSGRLKNNPLFILFLSFIATPLTYMILTVYGDVSLFSFISLNILFIFLTFIFRTRCGPPLDLDALFPRTRLTGPIVIILTAFSLMNILPRFGLIKSYFPIGDDMHRIGKTVSIAESPASPLFYHFPVTNMTIYYYVAVGSGLLTKFSQNQITADKAWFIHTSLWIISLLFFLGIVGENLYNHLRAKLTFLFSLTFAGGFEYYIALIKGIDPIRSSRWTDMEWWTDWFTKTFNIHFQISSPYTLSFWVPQHLFAGVLSLFIFLLLKSGLKAKIWNQIFLGILFAAMFGYSLFVFLPVVVSYTACQLVRLARKEATFRRLIRDHLPTISFFVLLSLNLTFLYLTAEKNSWFELRVASFWFLENNLLINKAINLLLTVPSLLIIELGGTSLILLYAAKRFLRGETDGTNYFWHFNIIFPFTSMFFIRAADDNNIALRSTIPALIALAFFAGRLVDQSRRRTPLLLYLLFTLGLPTTLTIFRQRLIEQKTYNLQALKPIYKIIDRKVPINSVVLTDEENQRSAISTLAHRFTFKPLKEFNVTDREYSAKSRLERYGKYTFADIGEIDEFLTKIKNEYPSLRTFNYFLLTRKQLNRSKVAGSDGYFLYQL